MSNIQNKLRGLGIVLPAETPPVANYVPFVRTGNLLFLSGAGPSKNPDGTSPTGKLGRDLTVEQGYEAARLTGINQLARLLGATGDLDKVTRIVKLLCMVNATPDFANHPAVANGCSDLFVQVFGEKGKHARSAVGMVSLPGNIPVEVEMVVEIEN